MSRALLEKSLRFVNRLIRSEATNAEVFIIRGEIESELAKPDPEPVAKIIERDIEGTDDKALKIVWAKSTSILRVNVGDYLYLSPPQPKPLTDEEIRNGESDNFIVAGTAFRLGIKYAEKKHGIGE